MTDKKRLELLERIVRAQHRFNYELLQAVRIEHEIGLPHVNKLWIAGDQLIDKLDADAEDATR